MKLFQWLLVSIFFAQSSAEVFSAINELEALTSQGEKLVKEYRWLIDSLEDAVAHFKRKVDNIEKENVLIEKNPLDYITIPLNALLLIKYFSYDITKARSRILTIHDEFTRRTESVRISDGDFKGAVQGLVRLQAMYELNPKDLARGIIENKKYRDDLQADDVFAIGEDLLDTKQHSLSLPYLELALEKNEETKEMPRLQILKRIQECQFQSGNPEKVVEAIDEMLKLQPNNQTLQDLRLKMEFEKPFAAERKAKAEKRELNVMARDGLFSEEKEIALTSITCRGKVVRNPKELTRLFCRYVSKSFFSLIGPFKVEELNLHPYIALFHDVIAESESNALKSIAKQNLSRAETLETTLKIMVDQFRVAKLSWHDDDTGEIFSRLTKRVGDMTGINMKTAETWQTQNYGIGGHYVAHHDFFEKGFHSVALENGNRIATSLFYLSDVEKGGATAFPYLHLAVFPKKGSALFWWNLSTSGEPEWYTKHSGCPVLVGSKWVANKWLSEYGQEFTRPCGLHPAPTDPNYFTKFF